jgi:Zn-dependent protease
MRLGWRIGPIGGVRLAVNLSWLIVFVLIVLALEGVRMFPVELPPLMRWAASAAVAVLFFASVIAHELVHAIVARRSGVPVDEIGLSIIGTQGQLERTAPTPRGELSIALSGPIVSLVVGGALLGLWLALPPAAAADPTGVVRQVVWLIGTSNLLLGAVNLLPGTPFDGGRAARALLWARTGDLMRASAIAASAGRLLAYGVVGIGLAWAATGDVLNGAWLALLGWFLSQASQMQHRRVEINRLVEGLSVGEVMEHDYAVIGPNLTLDTLLNQHAMGGATNVYPVTDEGRLLGAVEIERARRYPRQRWPQMRVGEVMTTADRLPRLTVVSSAMEALMIFDRSRATALPVTDVADRARLVGMLTRDGLLNVLRARRRRLDAAPDAPSEPAG